MKETKAETEWCIWTNCPYCNSRQNQFYELREYLNGELRVKEIEAQITCDDCHKEFIINEITY